MFEPIRYAIHLSPAIISASLILSSMTSAIAGEPAWQNGQTPFDTSIAEQITSQSQNNTPTSLPQETKTQGTPANTTLSPIKSPAKSSNRSLSETFNRAFNNDTGRFYEITNISGQLNQIFGWRSFLRGSFFDNQITNDGKTVETVYNDAMRQQTAGPRVVSRDLPNPFDTSLLENPSYSGTTPPPYYP